MKPHIIVFESGINDGVWTPGRSDAERGMLTQNTLMGKCLQNSNLFLFLYYVTHSRQQQMIFPNVTEPKGFYATSMYVPGKNRVSEEEFRSNIVSVEKIAKQVGAKLYFIFPPLYNEYCRQRIWKSADLSHANEIDVCAALSSLPTITLSDLFLPYDEGHLSRKGHQFVADLIWKHLFCSNHEQQLIESQ
jgi:hypothetical protein